MGLWSEWMMFSADVATRLHLYTDRNKQVHCNSAERAMMKSSRCTMVMFQTTKFD